MQVGTRATLEPTAELERPRKGNVLVDGLPDPPLRMHSVRVSEGRGHRSIARDADPFVVSMGRRGRRVWISRFLFLLTVVVAWCGVRPAFAASSASSVAALVSSAAVPAMSLRPEEAKRDARESRAPLCDMRCATTFAPAPQFQDEEVALAVSDEDDDSPSVDLVRVVPGGSPQADASHGDPCTLAPPRVSPAPPEAMLAPIAASHAHGPRGVPGTVERPPRG